MKYLVVLTQFTKLLGEGNLTTTIIEFDTVTAAEEAVKVVNSTNLQDLTLRPFGQTAFYLGPKSLAGTL